MRRTGWLLACTSAAALGVAAGVSLEVGAEGFAFSPPVVAIPDGPSDAGGLAMGEPSMLVEPDGRLVLSAHFQPFDCETGAPSDAAPRPCVWASLDHGATWSVIGGESTGMASNDVHLARSSTGVLYQGLMTNLGAGTGVGGASLARTSDGGSTWTTSVAVGGMPLVDRPWVVPLPGDDVLMTFTAPPGNIWVVASADGGATFGRPRPVTSVPPQLVLSVPGVPAVSPADGSILQPYLFSSDPGALTLADGDMDRLGVAVSTDNGQTWSEGTILELPEGRGIVSVPVAAIDEAGDAYLSFTTVDGSGGSTAVLMRGSDEGWATPVAVAPGPSSHLPWVIAGAPGRVAMAWIQSPSRGAWETAAPWTVQAGLSRDGGRTWIRSDVSRHTVFVGGGRQSKSQIWDYLALAADPDGCLNVAWQDRIKRDPSGYETQIAFARQQSGPGLFGTPCQPT